MTDFGIEESFDKAALRMQEHHGVKIHPKTIHRVTLNHASRAAHMRTEEGCGLRKPGRLIVEMDGEMVPLVETSGEGDKRKSRKCLWSELRVGAAQRVNEVEWKYACSFKTPNDLGDRVNDLLRKSFGWKGDTRLYSVGDGAKWITEQLERIAGTMFDYTIDLYHLCEYIAQAASGWATDVGTEINRLREMLKAGKVTGVIEELKERERNDSKHEGIRKCLQYIENRPGQFRYQKSIQEGLPIGSGKIESTHRHLIQARLKKAGAWWKKDNAAVMAELRVARANNQWHILWQDEKTLVCSRMAA